MPRGEEVLNGQNSGVERWEVLVVGSHTTSELPYAFNAVQLRAVWRKELQRKARCGLVAPLFMHAGMVVADVVEGDHDAAAGMATGLTQFLEKGEEGVAIERVFLALKDELAVS